MSKGQNSQSKSTKNPKFNPSDNSVKTALLEKRKQALQNTNTNTTAK
jgi:hypothetical protein